MIKNLENCVSMNNENFFLTGLNDVDYEYNKYIQYKNEKLNVIDSYLQVDFYVLSILEKLGFPMKHKGTYFYKLVITSVIDYLVNLTSGDETLDYSNLLEQLKNGFSPFYHEIARNELDMGLKSFHLVIADAISNINYGIINPEVGADIFGKVSSDLDYGEQALMIGSYVANIPIDFNTKKEKSSEHLSRKLIRYKKEETN